MGHLGSSAMADHGDSAGLPHQKLKRLLEELSARIEPTAEKAGESTEKETHPWNRLAACLACADRVRLCIWLLGRQEAGHALAASPVSTPSRVCTHQLTLVISNRCCL